MTPASQQLPHVSSPADSAGDAPVTEFDVRFGYSIGSHRFVLDKTLLTEIVIRPRLYEIPKCPPWLCGVINLRGNILAVIDLSESLSTVCRSTPGEFVLVIDRGSEALALAVDAPPKSLVNPVPAKAVNGRNHIQNEFIQVGVQADNTDWMLLDAKGLARSLKASSSNTL
jgi:chemotaxis signal transduction protein